MLTVRPVTPSELQNKGIIAAVVEPAQLAKALNRLVLNMRYVSLEAQKMCKD